MTLLKALLLLVVSIVFPLPVRAEFSGNDLLVALKGQEKDDIGYRSGYFDGYVSGVADKSAHTLWCPPNGTKVSQARMVVANYLKANPEVLHYSAHTLVDNALKKSFPCKATNKKWRR